MVIVYCFCFSYGIDFKTIFTLLLELLFGLLPVLLLKGKRIKLVFPLSLISSAIILIPFELIWLKDSQNLIFVILLPVFFDLYLSIMCCLSEGLYNEDSSILDVIWFNYGYFTIALYIIGGMLYPFYCCFKGCWNIFKE